MDPNKIVCIYQHGSVQLLMSSLIDIMSWSSLLLVYFYTSKRRASGWAADGLTPNLNIPVSCSSIRKVLQKDLESKTFSLCMSPTFLN